MPYDNMDMWIMFASVHEWGRIGRPGTIQDFDGAYFMGGEL